MHHLAMTGPGPAGEAGRLMLAEMLRRRQMTNFRQLSSQAYGYHT
jgi:hypothetical protein